MMQCKTRDFGVVELNASEVLTFTQPPFGFEEYKQYTLLTDPALGDAFAWLQSVEKPEICFVLMDAACFGSSYRPQLPPKALKMVGTDGFLVWLICSIPGSLESATVNLRSPIVINCDRHCGMQVVLGEDLPLRHPLMKGAV